MLVDTVLTVCVCRVRKDVPCAGPGGDGSMILACAIMVGGLIVAVWTESVKPIQGVIHTPTDMVMR